MEVKQDRVAQVAEGLQASQVVLAAAQEALQEVVLLAAVDQVLPRTAQDLATLLRRRDKILQVNNWKKGIVLWRFSFLIKTKMEGIDIDYGTNQKLGIWNQKS